MNRKLGLLIIAGFLSTQIFTLLHMAEHRFEKHDHNGYVCQMYLHCEHTKYGMTSVVAAFHMPASFASDITFSELLFVRTERYGVGFPRAPPLFS